MDTGDHRGAVVKPALKPSVESTFLDLLGSFAARDSNALRKKGEAFGLSIMEMLKENRTNDR